MFQPDGVANTQYIGPVFRLRDLVAALRASRRASPHETVPATSARQRIGPESGPVHLPDTGFLRLPAVLAVFPVSRSKWWDGVKAGKYPPAVKLGPNTTAWRVEDIRRLVQQYATEARA